MVSCYAYAPGYSPGQQAGSEASSMVTLRLARRPSNRCFRKPGSRLLERTWHTIHASVRTHNSNVVSPASLLHHKVPVQSVTAGFYRIRFARSTPLYPFVQHRILALVLVINDDEVPNRTYGFGTYFDLHFLPNPFSGFASIDAIRFRIKDIKILTDKIQERKVGVK